MAQLNRLEKTQANLSAQNMMRLTRLREDILREVREVMDGSISTKNASEQSRITTELQHVRWELRRSLVLLSSMMSSVPKENVILQNLFFPSMNLREEAISGAEEGTFEWIFEELNVGKGSDNEEMDGEEESAGETEMSSSPASSDGLEPAGDAEGTPNDFPDGLESGRNEERAESFTGSGEAVGNSRTKSKNKSLIGSRDPPVRNSLNKAIYETRQRYQLQKEELENRSRARVSFLKWLLSGSGVFHISGKAGSGKSTLMKFLYSHGRVMDELRVWAGCKTLVFGYFYFWKSTDAMQTSLVGLYRSILFETLRKCPDLIRAVFPKQWELLEIGPSYVHGGLLSTSDITKGFVTLVSQGTFSQHRFCFFVDGLDEFDGDTVDHVRLGRILQLWASNDDVKICASSRPYLEYENLARPPEQRVHLHEITKHDIYLFTRQMIERDDNFERLKELYLQLVEKVVKGSEGVFLWAPLVVCSLLAGMLRHDSVETLERKLEVIPRDINKLYAQLLESMEPDDETEVPRCCFWRRIILSAIH